MTNEWSLKHALGKTDRERRKNTLAVMQREQKQFAARWGRMERDLDQLELETRYRWAKDIKKLYEERNRYGNYAVERLLTLRSSFDREAGCYVMVAYYIEDSFFDAIVRFNKSDRARLGHITWKHLVTFAGVGDRKERDRLLKECMRENWSHYTLLEAVGLLSAEEPETAEQPDQEVNIASITRGITTRAKNLSKQVALLIDNRLHQSVKKIWMTDRPETAVRFIKARDAISGSIAQLHAAVSAFDGVLEVLIPQEDRPDGRNQAEDDDRPRLPQAKKGVTEGVA